MGVKRPLLFLCLQFTGMKRVTTSRVLAASGLDALIAAGLVNMNTLDPLAATYVHTVFEFPDGAPCLAAARTIQPEQFGELEIYVVFGSADEKHLQWVGCWNPPRKGVTWVKVWVERKNGKWIQGDGVKKEADCLGFMQRSDRPMIEACRKTILDRPREYSIGGRFYP